MTVEKLLKDRTQKTSVNDFVVMYLKYYKKSSYTFKGFN